MKKRLAKIIKTMPNFLFIVLYLTYLNNICVSYTQKITRIDKLLVLSTSIYDNVYVRIGLRTTQTLPTLSNLDTVILIALIIRYSIRTNGIDLPFGVLIHTVAPAVTLRLLV